MLTAIVLANANENHGVAGRSAEQTARTLAFLVSAAVQGVIGDAVLIGEDSASMRHVADYAGCALVDGDDSQAALQNALSCARRDHVFLLKNGYAAEPALIEEVSDFLQYGRGPKNACGLIREAPASLVTRLFPDASPLAGLVAPKNRCQSIAARNFDDLARRLRPAVAFSNRARRML